jgi:hypothetical protein
VAYKLPGSVIISDDIIFIIIILNCETSYLLN